MVSFSVPGRRGPGARSWVSGGTHESRRWRGSRIVAGGGRDAGVVRHRRRGWEYKAQFGQQGRRRPQVPRTSTGAEHPAALLATGLEPGQYRVLLGEADRRDQADVI